jgi:Ca2+-binding EF-hand superfamily protein
MSSTVSQGTKKSPCKKHLTPQQKNDKSKRKLRKKILREFSQLDTDGKGYIREEDLYHMWQKTGVATNSPAVIEFQNVSLF